MCDWLLLPSEVDRNDTSYLLGKGGEHGVGEIEVLSGRVAPSSGGAAGAGVGGRDGDGFGALVAPPCSLLVARELKARSTSSAFVEQRVTQRSC